MRGSNFAGEDQVVVAGEPRLGAVGPQRLGELGADGDVADPVAALGGIEDALVEPATDLYPAGAEVDVIPAKGDQLADAQPSLRQELHHQLPTVWSLGEQPSELRLGECAGVPVGGRAPR